jgi:hypothetical protein
MANIRIKTRKITKEQQPRQCPEMVFADVNSNSLAGFFAIIAYGLTIGRSHEYKENV